MLGLVEGPRWPLEMVCLIYCHPAVNFWSDLHVCFPLPQLYHGRWTDDPSGADGDGFSFPESGRYVTHSCLVRITGCVFFGLL